MLLLNITTVKKKKKHIEDINMGINTLESLKQKDMIESKRISIALWEIIYYLYYASDYLYW